MSVIFHIDLSAPWWDVSAYPSVCVASRTTLWLIQTDLWPDEVDSPAAAAVKVTLATHHIHHMIKLAASTRSAHSGSRYREPRLRPSVELTRQGPLSPFP